MYADDGKGVHGHITPQEVDQIWALQLPTVEADKFTRILGFYGKDGNLIVGLYVSEGVKDFDPKAVEGFERTRELLKKQPRLPQLKRLLRQKPQPKRKLKGLLPKKLLPQKL